MTNQYEFYVSAVQNGNKIEDRFIASSSKQAWYKLGKKYGFNMYGFTVLAKFPIKEQLEFNI